MTALLPSVRADVIGARIHLHAEFRYLALCKSIPGAVWNTEHRAWLYPANPWTAKEILKKFPDITASEAVRSLVAHLQNVRQACGEQTARGGQLESKALPLNDAMSAPAPLTPPEPITQPTVLTTIPLLKTRPWKHQVLAYNFLLAVLKATGGSAMLAMGMGTGKSLTAIGAICNMSANLTLIVCPLRVVDVWPDQILRHAGIDIDVLPLGDEVGSVAKKKERAEAAVNIARARKQHLVIVINYESLWREPFAQWVLKQEWGMVVCDECVPAGTAISTPSGQAAIETIREGDTVLGFDHTAGRVVETRVMHTFAGYNTGARYRVGHTDMTSGHPVWTNSRRYVPVSELGGEDCVYYLQRDGNLRMVRLRIPEKAKDREVLQQVVFREVEDVQARVRGDIESVDCSCFDTEDCRVFNIETGTGNYFAGGLLVHNSHRIKKASGKASMYLARLRAHAKYRLALTGTPMPHSPLDVYAQFRFLDKAIFGNSYHAFKQRYAVMGGFQNKQVVQFQNMPELEALMRTVTFRVGKDVLDLPEERHVTYHCYLDSGGEQVYKSMEKDFVAEVKNGTVTAANAMVKLLRLQQITGGAVRADNDQYVVVDESKRRLLADTLEDIGKDDPVVVFCRFRSDLDAVHAAAAGLGYTSMELSGRRDELKAWQAGGAQVLAVQISAGGVGVDLTRSRYDIYYSLSHSLGEYDQALSRVHRPGQTRDVTHIYLAARGTVDEKIKRALDARADVIESILKEIKEQ